MHSLQLDLEDNTSELRQNEKYTYIHTYIHIYIYIYIKQTSIEIVKSEYINYRMVH